MTTTICPFCDTDPFDYVNVGIGNVPIGVTCCQYGVQYFQYGKPYDEVLKWFVNDFGHEPPMKWDNPEGVYDERTG